MKAKTNIKSNLSTKIENGEGRSLGFRVRLDIGEKRISSLLVTIDSSDTLIRLSPRFLVDRIKSRDYNLW